MDRLPQEVVDEIIDDLSSDKASLKSCALTVRRWLPRSSMHLFMSCRLREWHDNPHALPLATRCTERISTNLVVLSGLRITSAEDIAFVGLLPKLQELSISSVDNVDALAQAYGAPTPTAQRARRSLALISGFDAPLFVPEWLLRQFEGVATVHLLRVSCSPTVAVSHAQHAVTHLKTSTEALRTLHALADILDATALSSVTCRVGYQYEAYKDLDNFMLTTGRHVRNFSYVMAKVPNRSSIAARMPTLTLCTTLTSVTLFTNALCWQTAANQWERTVQFIRALPRSVTHFKLMYCEVWRDGARLANDYKRVDWAALGRVLESCPDLALLELGAVCKSYSRSYRWRPPILPSLSENPETEAVVRSRLPSRLRAFAPSPGSFETPSVVSGGEHPVSSYRRVRARRVPWRS